MLHWLISQIPGFVGGVIAMGFYYYYNKANADKAMAAVIKEKDDAIAAVKKKAGME